MPTPAKLPQAKVIPVVSPIKGKVEQTSREQQPPSTCWDANNMVPYDRYDRPRVSQRVGLIEQWPGVILGALGTMVQGMLPVNYMAGPTWPIPYFQYIGNVIHFSNPAATSTTAFPSWGLSAPFRASFTANVYASGLVNGSVSTGSLTQQLLISLGSTLINTLTVSTQVHFVSTGNPSTVYTFVAPGDSNPPNPSTTIFSTSSASQIVGVGVPVQLIVNSTGASTYYYGYYAGSTAFVPSTSAATLTFTYSTAISGLSNLAEAGMIVDAFGPGFTPQHIGATYYYQLETGTGSLIYLTGDPHPASDVAIVAGAQAYLGTPPLITNSVVVSGNLQGNVLVGMALVNGVVYIVDGTNFEQFNLSTNTLTAFTASTGTAPTNCRLACNWRGRLVLAGDLNNPQNFYMSRIGAPGDFDYAQTDPAAAVAGNPTDTFGQIGEPITALIPYTDDYMIISCVHSIWMLEGDPADGGTMVRVSDQMGVLGPNAWCLDSIGTLYFVASGGLHSMMPKWEYYRPPQLLSDHTFDSFFRSLDEANTYLSLQFDPDRHYLYVFATPTVSTSPTQALTYDLRNGGLWPFSYPACVGPTCTCLYAGDWSSTMRSVLLGCWDGLPRKANDSAYTDDGSTIVADIVLGPFHPFPEAGKLIGTTIDFGESFGLNDANISTWNVNVTVDSGVDAYEVTEGSTDHTFTVNCPLDRRQKTFRQRLRGGWFSLTLSNNVPSTAFSFESAMLEFDQSGRNRGVR